MMKQKGAHDSQQAGAKENLKLCHGGPSKHTSYFSLNSIRVYTHANKKNATLSFAYGLFNSYSKFWGRYVDKVLHPNVLQIYQTVGSNFFFQQDNVSIPSIWQGTVCKLVMSYPLDWRFGSGSISNWPPMGYSRPVDTWSYPFPAATFPEFEH